MNDVEKQLESARKRLLDLTLRNRLINYKPNKARSLAIVDEIIREIYDLMVINEKVMQFKAGDEADESENDTANKQEASTIWHMPPPSAGVEERHVDKFLQTKYKSESLQKRLFYIYQQARSFLEEQGYSILFLALGFLEWSEMESPDQLKRAPLILVPVELERASASERFKLKWTGDDIFTNISLKEKLIEVGVDLPEFEMPEAKEGIDKYFEAVNNSISKKPGWRVLSETALDFFSFTKFVMYKDLDPSSWPLGMSPADNPIVKQILNQSATASPGFSATGSFSENEVDSKLHFKDLYHIYDADPSQIAVIEDVKAGASLVVEGPPGTGKSQTITNIIAELLAGGKCVLFVSEKMAALEVVKSRLDCAGLGDFCLEIHSRKANKKAVLDELRRTVEAAPAKAISLDKEFDEIELLRKELNEYAGVLRSPVGKLGRSTFSLYGIKETALKHFESKGRPMPRVAMDGAGEIDDAKLIEAENALREISQILPMVTPISSHPWNGCSPRVVLPADAADIGSKIDECLKNIDDFQAKLKAVCDVSNITDQDTKNQLAALDEYRVLSKKFFRIFIKRYRELKKLIGLKEGKSRKELNGAIDALTPAKAEYFSKRDTLLSLLAADTQKIFGKPEGDLKIEETVARLKLWKAEIPKIQRWAQYAAIRNACLTSAAAPMLGAIESDLLQQEDILPCFRGNLADDLLRLAFTAHPGLARFVGELHEGKIKRFMELDRELIRLNRLRLAAKLGAERPQIGGGASHGSEAGVLLGEFNRKRGLMPIRKLFMMAGGLIQKIKPCFMMSPLSIAQFLDPRATRFDVIIFDEASQVRPEDGLGAIHRGRQLAVMGDTRQLPPTAFFDKMLEGAEDEDEEAAAGVGDVESILHQCKRSFPSKTLRWHYRSRHESLIAVSNREFYDNKLLIYPSPYFDYEGLGLKFRQVADAVYDRGRSSANRVEARAVAEAAMEHYCNNPNKSLGVGAFSVKQQQAIQEEIELKLREHPEMEQLFSPGHSDPFFVKNLETIQGDERDVIFLSIGYGFDESKRLSANFGPLNQEGGERRLNVLITRARERCVVFSNFKAMDLKADADSPFGVRALKVFLDYAENRKMLESEATGMDTDSPFEDAIYEFIRSNGHEVKKQVGCAGFRIDLAIVDPKTPGRYLLGIECDGATYHSSLVARDRDRLRQQILENLGWRIHRVWSTDWYLNRAETGARLLKAIEDAMKIPIEPPAPPAMAPATPLPQKPVPAICSDVKHNTKAAEIESGEAYKVCDTLGIPHKGELNDLPPQTLAKAVARVVDVEGPVHVEEVVRRIRILWGLKRIGPKMRETIHGATELAVSLGTVRQNGEFLWPAGDRPVIVRLRSDDPPPSIELICDEEIAEAVMTVIGRQFATMPDELVVQASRLMGFKVTSEAISERIGSIVNKLVNMGQLQKLPNGMVDKAK